MYLSCCELAKIINQTPAAVTYLITIGVVKPVVVGNGRGRQHRLSRVNAVSIVLALGMRGCGFHWNAVRRVVEVVARHSEAELLEHFEAGRTCLMICGERCMPEFLPADSIARASGLAKTAAGKTATVVCLDVGGIFTKTVAAIEQQIERNQREHVKSLEAALN